MSNAWPATLKVGELSTNAQCSGDLGNIYSVGNSCFQLVQTNSLIISNAAGKLMQMRAPPSSGLSTAMLP